jgi:hypothetical protein
VRTGLQKEPRRPAWHRLPADLIFFLAFFFGCRLQAIATPLVVNMEKVQIIPPPRDVDPRVLCWKGGAVLGKMEAVADLCVSRHDWVRRIRATGTIY